MPGRFTYELHKIPGYSLILKRDGQFEREMQFVYPDAAEQAGIDWVFDQEAELAASMDRHPASQFARSTGRHLRLVEDAA